MFQLGNKMIYLPNKKERKKFNNVIGYVGIWKFYRDVYHVGFYTKLKLTMM